MGITHHAHGVDNVEAIANLAMVKTTSPICVYTSAPADIVLDLVAEAELGDLALDHEVLDADVVEEGRVPGVQVDVDAADESPVVLGEDEVHATILVDVRATGRGHGLQWRDLSGSYPVVNLNTPETVETLQ